MIRKIIMIFVMHNLVVAHAMEKLSLDVAEVKRCVEDTSRSIDSRKQQLALKIKEASKKTSIQELLISIHEREISGTSRFFQDNALLLAFAIAIGEGPHGSCSAIQEYLQLIQQKILSHPHAGIFTDF